MSEDKKTEDKREEVKDEKKGKKHGDTENSAFFDAVLPIVLKLVAWMMDKVTDVKVIDLAIRSLSPEMVMAASAVPSGIGVVFGQLAKAIPNPHMRDLIKDSLNEAVLKLVEKIEKKGGLKNVTPEEYGTAIVEGFDKAAKKKYVVIDGLLHSQGCVRIQNRMRQPQAQGQNPNPQQSPGNVEVTLLEAEQQHIMCAPCCFEGVNADIKTQDEAPAKAEAKKPPPRSPMEVIHRAKLEDRTVFFTWLKGLPANDRVRVDAFLKHLDSEEEFTALLQVIKEQPDLVYEMLTLLENSNGSLQTKQYLLLFGQAIERHSMQALAALKIGIMFAGRKAVEFDESFAPVADRLRKNDAAKKPRNTIAVLLSTKEPEKQGFWTSTGRFVKSLFLIV